MAIGRSQMSQQVSKPPNDMPKGLTYYKKKAVKLPVRVKEVKFVLKGKHGRKELLIHTHQLMQTLLLQNIAKIQIMPKNLKVGKEKAEKHNG